MQKMYENRALRKIRGAKRKEVTGEWRKFHNEELRDIYSSSNISRVMTSLRMRWECSTYERKIHAEFMGRKFKARDQSEGQGVGGILYKKCVLNTVGGWDRNEVAQYSDTGGRAGVKTNEHSGSMKFGAFVYKQTKCSLLKVDSSIELRIVGVASLL